MKLTKNRDSSADKNIEYYQYISNIELKITSFLI